MAGLREVARKRVGGFSLAGTAAWRAHVPVFELALHQASLEQAFMQLTEDSVDYRSGGASAAREVAA